MRIPSWKTGPLLLGLLAASCGEGTVSAPEPVPDARDLTEPLYDPNRVLQVSITMAPADWDSVRNQTRSILDIIGSSCLEVPVSPFTYHPADVTIDGTTVQNVGVRKKGFYGSLDTVKPSLKVKFHEYFKGQRYSGTKNLTFNNNKSDPSHVKQCLGYQVFAMAGIPAPRCNFAVVELNGQDLGVFTNVEPLKKPFIRRHFSSDAGNFYEGALSDFRSGWVDTFQVKTNEETNDRSDIEALVPLMEIPDGELVGELESVFALDDFFYFWAAELLISHADGYARNTNNFYLYKDPESDRFHFIPWGIDSTFANVDVPLPWEDAPAPVSIWAEGTLTRRLYELPETRERYRQTLRTLLDTVWNEQELLTEIDRMEALIEGHIAPADLAGFRTAVESVRDYVRGLRSRLAPELSGPPPSWDKPLRDPLCAETLGTVTGDFDTQWGTTNSSNPFAEGTATLSIDMLTGTLPAPDQISAISGLDPESGDHVVQVLTFTDPGTVHIAHIQLNPELLVPGTSQPFDWLGVFGYLVELVFPPPGCVPPPGEAECPPDFTVLGILGDGGLEITNASTVDGQPVVGTFTAEIYEPFF